MTTETLWCCNDYKIGEGTYGKVYRFGPNAMKVFSDRDDFNNEVRYLEMFNNEPKEEKYILQLRFLDPKQLFIATDLMDGTLADYFKLKERTHNRIKRTMKKLLRGLYTMHRRHVVHCDIKPQNVLMNLDGSLKIGDLGSAAQQGTYSFNGTNVVTGWYRPYELVFYHDARLPTHDSKWDVWSAGCILGELLLGRPMFPGRNLEEMRRMIQKFQNDKSVWQGMDPDALALLQDMLNPAPDERCSAKQALHHSYLTK